MGGEIIYLSLHCHHQNDSCIKMGSDVSHFNVSFIIVRDKVTRQCPQTTTFEEKGGPKRIRNEVPLLTSLTPYREAKLAHHLRVRESSYMLISLSLSLYIYIYALQPDSQKLRQRFLSTSSRVGLIGDGPFSSFQGRP